MNKSDIKKELKKCNLFSQLDENELGKIAAISILRSMSKRNLIFSEGDESIGFYVVVKGAVKLFKLSFEGKENVLKLVGPGESFAVSSCLYGEKHPCFAETKKLSTLIYIPIYQFSELLSENPQINLKLVSLIPRNTLTSE